MASNILKVMNMFTTIAIMVGKISTKIQLNLRYNSLTSFQGSFILKTTKKQYSVAEKTKIALEAIKGELTTAQISSKYGVHATQISKWKQQALESMQSGFNSKASKEDNDQHELIDKLYRQIGQLSIECDWLKKKSELFKSGK